MVNVITSLPIQGTTTNWGSSTAPGLNAAITALDNVFAAAGNGTSVGINVGTGKTLTVGGTQTIPSGGSLTIASGATFNINAAATFTKSIVKAKGAAIALAATTNIWTALDGDTIHIGAGSGPLTSFGTAPQAGATIRCIADVAFTLTYNATTLQLPTAANIPVSIGDSWDVFADTTANMIVTNYTKANGVSVGYGEIATVSASGTAMTFVLPVTTARRIIIMCSGLSQSSAVNFGLQIGSGSLVTTGYIYSVASISAATAFSAVAGSQSSWIFALQNAIGDNINAQIILTRQPGTNTWQIGGTYGRLTGSATATGYFSGGAITLAGALDRFSVTPSGGTFSGGIIGATYE